MGWNEGYSIIEKIAVSAYDKNLLTKELMDCIMEPFKGCDVDSGGSNDLKTKDGLCLEQVVCKVMEPEKYEEVMANPVWYEDEEPGTELYDDWHSRQNGYELFDKIWRDVWHMW